MQSKGRVALVTNATLGSLTMNANSYLELAGRTLTVKALTIINKVYWRGKTIVYFHSGNQQGVAGLEMAEFDGPPEELLAHYFAE
jgi:hypothetical protein